ncbi:MAG: uroporphyrinogen decarboxylase family protein [Anaerolineae bacterium]|jgi:hypothetical protein|nr:uroporphyrinogen decarboxylase family protein [Anaerolineae bacterium]
MKEMTSRERVLAALHQQPVDRIPYCEHLVDPVIGLRTIGILKTIGVFLKAAQSVGLKTMFRALKAMGMGDAALSDPEIAQNLYELMGAIDPPLSKALGRDNITYWGAAGCFEGGQAYLLNPEEAYRGSAADGIIKSFEDLDKMVFRTDIDQIISGAEQFLKNKGDLAACALVFLGLDPCWHSMGFETFCEACLLEPELVTEVLGRITDWYAMVMEEICKLDFDFIWAADDIAYHTSPFFSPRLYRRLLLPHTKKVADKITKPWIYHSDGNLVPIWDDLLSQGMNAIHPLESGSMDLDYLKQNYGDKVSFVGGIDLRILEAGTPEETETEVKKLISILGPGYGYLLGASNSVTPDVIPENERAMLAALAKYGVYDAEGNLPL